MNRKLEMIICQLDPKMNEQSDNLKLWSDLQPRKVFDDISIGKDIFEDLVEVEKSVDPLADALYPL